MKYIFNTKHIVKASVCNVACNIKRIKDGLINAACKCADVSVYSKIVVGVL